MSEPVRITGLPELRRKLTPALVAGPARRFLDRWAIGVQTDARANAPNDRGRLRGSIAKEIEGAPGQIPTRAIVGTNIAHGPAMEGGTGLLADLPGGTNRRHWPPAAALDVWARRHGVRGGGAAVAAAIGKRGGLKPRRFLRNAHEASRPRIPGLLDRMAREVEREASKGVSSAAD